MKKLTVVLLSCLVLLGMLSGCGGGTDAPASTAAPAPAADSAAAPAEPAEAPSGDPIRVALVGPITGSWAEYGTGFEWAAQCQVERWNANGGINGRSIELLSYDERESREEGLAIAQLIADEGDIYGVVGHFGSTMVVPDIYEPNEMVLIAPSASSEGFSELGDYIFRNNATIYTEASAMLDCAMDTGKKKLGIVYLNDDWGNKAYETTQQLLLDRPDDGLEIVAAETVLEGNVDFASVISKFRDAGVESAVMFCYYNTVVPFVKEAENTIPDMDIICGVNCYNDTFLEAGGVDVEGCLAPAVFGAAGSDPAVQEFVTAFRAKSGGATPSSLSAQAYDSMGILLTAIEQLGGELDRPAIRDAVANIDYDGVAGNVQFDEIGDASKDFNTMIVKDNIWVDLNG